MSDDKIQGAARTVEGKIGDVVGAVTGDAKTQAQGKVDQVAGKAQQALGDAKDAVASAADEAGSKLGGVADRITTTASDFGHQAYTTGADVANKVGRQVRENPVTMMITAGLLGLVVGYLLGTPPHERVIQAGRVRLSYRDRS